MTIRSVWVNNIQCLIFKNTCNLNKNFISSFAKFKSSSSIKLMGLYVLTAGDFWSGLLAGSLDHCFNPAFSKQNRKTAQVTAVYTNVMSPSTTGFRFKRCSVSQVKAFLLKKHSTKPGHKLKKETRSQHSRHTDRSITAPPSALQFHSSHVSIGPTQNTAFLVIRVVITRKIDSSSEAENKLSQLNALKLSVIMIFSWVIKVDYILGIKVHGVNSC